MVTELVKKSPTYLKEGRIEAIKKKETCPDLDLQGEKKRKR